MGDLGRIGEPLFTAAGVRALDRAAIDREGIPGAVLMARAGRAAFALLQRCHPGVRALEVLCGTGNNGGDGFVVARLARDAGWDVRVRLVGDRDRIRGDARAALDAACAAGVEPEPFEVSAPLAGAVLVDALLGTGLQGEVRPEQAAAIGWANDSGLPVLAVDVPSGLCSDTGRVLGAAVRAGHTISFIGRKQGCFTASGPDFCGERHFDDLGVPAAVLEGERPVARLLRHRDFAGLPGPRPRTAHKGHFGHVLVVGGNLGMGGAALMAGMAAARAGAGLVSLAVHPGNEVAAVARCPELMARGVGYAHELAPLLVRASVVVLGPGLGRGPWAQQLLQAALAARLPTVLDADALNALADGEVDPATCDPARWILSPHPGEAARLLRTGTADVGHDRFGALAALLARYPGAVLLKGAGTLVGDAASGSPPGVCAEGNPGMASGGMGDVLSGLLGALLAQDLAPGLAARLGACVHARAADLAAQADGERGLLATDLLPWIRRLLNGVDAQ